VVYGHKGMECMMPFLIERLYLRPEDLFMPCTVFAFCNFFVARKRFWQRYFDYVDNILIDLAADALKGGVAGEFAEGPSHYAKNPSFTMKPFIVERLFSSFLPQSGLTVCGINLDQTDYKAKFGALLGNTLFQLSALKNQARRQGEENHIRWERLSRKLTAGVSLMTLMNLDDPDFDLVEVGLSAA
jgi:hypothetical protein